MAPRRDKKISQRTNQRRAQWRRMESLMANKITRKAIINAIINDDATYNALANALNLDDDGRQNVLIATLSKWDNALSKASKSNSNNKNDDIIINDIVPFILASETPVTAKTINDEFVHAERTNKASALLRRGIEMGLISRDRVRKNANFEYAEPNYDWNAYIAEYDKKVAEKAAARIAKARANRS